MVRFPRPHEHSLSSGLFFFFFLASFDGFQEPLIEEAVLALQFGNPDGHHVYKFALYLVRFDQSPPSHLSFFWLYVFVPAQVSFWPT